jgi:tetratricopeptide (TPR) repeat protein
MALRDLAQVVAFQGDQERAWALMQERLELYRALGDDVGVNRTLRNLAILASERGDLEQARALITPVLAWARGVSDYELTDALDTLGEIAFGEGNYEESRALFVEELAVNERLRHLGAIAGTCGGIGLTYLYQGRLEDALPFLNRSFALWRELSDRVVGWQLPVFALVAAMRGEARRAALLLGKADSLLEESGETRPPAPDFPYERATRAASQALGSEIFQAVYAEGQAMAFDEALQHAQDALRNG